MPIGIKDIIETIDMPTQNGSPLFEGLRGERDAASVAALREGGAVVGGKSDTTELAASEPRGTRNPQDTARTPGGPGHRSAAAGGVGAGSGEEGGEGAAVEPAPPGARESGVAINTWERRCPTTSYREGDAGKLSRAMLDRGRQGEARARKDYGRHIADRDRRRAVYHT